jgi:predicted nuclease of predicted toxin-antitoxin system
MKLLFDHNLPPLLVSRLADLFPHSQHVFALGLDRASDWEIRDYARQSGYFIVTKDADFSDLCVLLGFPPKNHLDSSRKLFGKSSRRSLAATSRRD